MTPKTLNTSIQLPSAANSAQISPPNFYPQKIVSINFFFWRQNFLKSSNFFQNKIGYYEFFPHFSQTPKKTPITFPNLCSLNFIQVYLANAHQASNSQTSREMISSPNAKSVSDRGSPQIELAVWPAGRAPSTTTQLKIASVPRLIRLCSKETQMGCSWTRNSAQKRAI